MNLSIIIVNYKTPHLTLRCIESIYKSNLNITFEIIVIDNFSQDNSKSVISSKYQNVIWINNQSNEGFGRANNKGVSKAKGKYILLLNSDMLVLDQTISECIKYISKDPTIGVLGCKLLNEDESLQKSVYYYVGDYMGVLQNNLLVDFLYKKKPTHIKAVMGAYMLIPRDIINKINGFDPDFFMYAEELELCHRISKLGYKIDYFENVTAIHKHNGSSAASDWSYKQNYLSNALLYLKIRGVGGYVTYHILMIFNFFTNMLLFLKMDRNYKKDFWQDQKYYFSNFANYIKIPFLYSKSMGNGKRLLKRA